MMCDPLPWHQALFHSLKNQPPGSGSIILYGPKGAGKQRLLEALIPQGKPNVLVLASLSETETIGVDTIRSLNTFLQTRAQGTECFKEVLIWKAASLSAAAIQALLKTLEEPVVPIRFWFVADRLSQLPATLCSRSQKYYVPLPPFQEALQWLKHCCPGLTETKIALGLRYHHGSPLLAKAWLEEGPTELLAQRLEALSGLLTGTKTAFSIFSSIPEAEIGSWFDIFPIWFSELMHDGGIAKEALAPWHEQWIASLKRRLEVPSLNLKLELYRLLYIIEQNAAKGA